MMKTLVFKIDDQWEIVYFNSPRLPKQYRVKCPKAQLRFYFHTPEQLIAFMTREDGSEHAEPLRQAWKRALA